MKLPTFKYIEPKSIRRACHVLEEHGDEGQAIAGGTDLMMAWKNRLKVPEIVVDLASIPHLNHIRYSDKDGLRVGALVTLRRLASNPVVKEKYPALTQAALAVGTPQLQAMGTIGGNLCQDSLCAYYNRSPSSRQMLEPCHKMEGTVCHAVAGSKICWGTYCGDIAPTLLVLQARVTIAKGEGKEVFPLSQLYSADGKRPTSLKPGAIVTEIHVPSPAPRSGAIYLKFRLRRTIDYPLLGVATRLTMDSAGTICEDAAVALTAVERTPLLIKEAANARGKKLTDTVVEALAEAAYKQAHPLHNICGVTPEYRKEMVKVYVMSAITQTVQTVTQAGGAA